MSYALSNSDISKITNHECRVISYDELFKYKTLESAMGEYACLVLLYEFKDNFGHWCLIQKISPNKIEFFDSYGIFPDDTMEEFPDKFQRIPYLRKLMKDSPYLLSYNDYKLQDNDSNFCGYWVCARILLRFMNLKDFVNIWLNRKYIPDKLVQTFIKGLAPHDMIDKL